MKHILLWVFSIHSLVSFAQCEIDSSINTLQSLYTGGAAIGVNEYYEGSFTFYLPFGWVEHPDFDPLGSVNCEELGVYSISGVPEGMNVEVFLDDGTPVDTTIDPSTQLPAYMYQIDELTGYRRICVNIYGTPTQFTSGDNSVVISLFLNQSDLPIPITGGVLNLEINFVVFSGFFTPEICVVTSDPATGYNEVIWNKLQSNITDAFRVYSTTPNTGQVLIGEVPYDSLSRFVDTVNTNPETSILYALSMVNGSGVESPRSTEHTSLHLRITPLNGEYYFDWNEYEPYLGNSESYIFYSGPSPNDLNPIMELPQGFYYWSQPETPVLTYFAVGTTLDLECVPSRNSGTNVFSNVVSNGTFIGVEKIDRMPVQILPNPTSESINVTTDLSWTQYALHDMTGNIVFSDKRSNNSIDLSSLPVGVYSLSLFTEDDRVVRTKVLKH